MYIYLRVYMYIYVWVYFMSFFIIKGTFFLFFIRAGDSRLVIRMFRGFVGWMDRDIC